MFYYLQLLYQYFKLGVLGELEYRSNFFIQILEAVLTFAVSLGGLFVIFSHTDTLGGWLPDQLLAIVGVHMLLGGILRLVISPSLNKFSDDVRTGHFDFILIKPANAQFLASVQTVEVWKLIDTALGFAVTLIAVLRLSVHVGVANTLLFALLMFVGGVIIYSFWIILAALAFWIVRAENIFQLFYSLFVAGRWPITIYPSWLRAVLTFIVPIAFAVTVPAQGLIGQLSTANIIFSLLLAGSLFVFSSWFFHIGIRNYSGASA